MEIIKNHIWKKTGSNPIIPACENLDIGETLKIGISDPGAKRAPSMAGYLNRKWKGRRVYSGAWEHPIIDGSYFIHRVG